MAYTTLHYQYKPCPRDRVNKKISIFCIFLQAGGACEDQRTGKTVKPARNPENGYYEYSWPDFLNLLYIRKLRGANLSLDAIEATCRSGDAESLLQGYRETIADLEKQVRELKRREMMLAITARHYERDAQATDQIRVIEAFDTKYDSYFDQDKPDQIRKRWIENVDLFTLVVCIEQRYFV